MTAFKTNFEQRAVAGGGTSRALDSEALTGQKVLTIIPEDDVTVSTLVGVTPSSEAFDFKAERRLTTLKAGIPYFAGDNSYFEEIEISGGNAALYS